MYKLLDNVKIIKITFRRCRTLQELRAHFNEDHFIKLILLLLIIILGVSKAYCIFGFNLIQKLDYVSVS